MKDSRGNRIVARENIIDHATEFYKKLYSSTNTPRTGKNWQTQQKDSQERQVSPILRSEVRVAIEQTKHGKTPGGTAFATNSLD